jgi:Zn-dependent protease
MSPQDAAIFAVALLSALTIHEYSHARAALAAGDDTAKLAGRISLNPFAHLDFIGTIFLVLMITVRFPIAWGKPVPINPGNFKNPRRDSLLVSLAGPLSNFILACILGLIFRFAGQTLFLTHAVYANLLIMCIAINLSLAFFNLIPIPPLDGSHILASLLPGDLGRRYAINIGRYGMPILLVLLVWRIHGVSMLSMIIGPPRDFMLNLLTGLTS